MQEDKTIRYNEIKEIKKKIKPTTVENRDIEIALGKSEAELEEYLEFNTGVFLEDNLSPNSYRYCFANEMIDIIYFIIGQPVPQEKIDTHNRRVEHFNQVKDIIKTNTKKGKSKVKKVKEDTLQANILTPKQ